MMRISLIVVAFAFSAAVVAAQLPDKFANWQHSSAVLTDQLSAPGFLSVVVPGTFGNRARQDLADLRVIDDQGTEVAYVLRIRRGGVRAVWRRARLLDPGYGADRFSEVTLDLGGDTRIHNRLRFDIEKGADFLTWVEIATGPDARAWTVIRERAPVYDLQQAGMGQSLEASYPDSTARHLRLRILDASRTYTVRSAEVAHEVVTDKEIVPAGVTLTPTDGGPKQSAWISAEGAPVTTLSEVRFETARPLFDRPVSVETSDDGRTWQRIAAGGIFRHTSRGVTHSSLTVAFPETSAARWRVLVYNYDDAPIADLQPAFDATARRVVFRADPARRYRLLFGNGRATPPVYDLARLTDAADLDAATPGTIGPAEINTGYRDPAPWTERNPWVLWVALGLAVVVIGGLAVRTLRGSA